ncbi:MAG: hypothetical protein AB1483_09270 [Candidatus Zixiibacteriota bacterium]
MSMSDSDHGLPMESTSIDINDVDLSSLVGHEVVLYTEQYEGKALAAKVILVSNGAITVDRSGANGMIDSLINNQKTIVQFVYRGQRISVDARLKRTGGGKCTLHLGEKLVPLSRRRYTRYDMNRAVKCAVLPSRDFDPQRIGKLRWIETDSINFSSGGIQLCLPKQLNETTYLLLSIDLRDVGFPALIIGQVRYAHAIDRFRYRVGIEFIVSEAKERHFDMAAIKKFPPVVFEYSDARRKELNKELAVRLQQ